MASFYKKFPIAEKNLLKVRESSRPHATHASACAHNSQTARPDKKRGSRHPHLSLSLTHGMHLPASAQIFCSNRHVQLQVVNNRTGHIFLWASTLEKELRQALTSTWDKKAARACAGLLARRARAAEQQQITWERHNSFQGTHHKAGRKLPVVGKVKVVIDTLLAHGMEFVQHANKRPPRNPWEKAAPQNPIGEMKP